ncbi:MAG TPA: hypothetical protein PKI14_17650 [Fervidobacterium sp.]|nr:hypothetical protein [Fervidobacterium sp.]
MENENRNMSIVESINVNEAVQVMNKINQFQQVIKSQLRPKIDFGIIPGTDKPTLLKPGAEKILMLLGVTSTYELIEKVQDYDKGFFAFTVKCELSKDGIVITEGLGHCNSRERKFMSQKVDPYTIANTCLKIAKKRAQVDAVLTIASLSDVFTQDVEDMYIVTPVLRQQKEDEVDDEHMEYLPPEEAGSTIVTFGKYKGKTIGEIASIDMNYVRWLAHKAEDVHIRLAAETFVHLDSKMRKPANPFDTLAKQAVEEHNAGKTIPLDDESIDEEEIDIPF